MSCTVNWSCGPCDSPCSVHVYVPLKKFLSVLAPGVHHLACLAVFEPHLALYLATGGVQISWGAVVGPLKVGPLQRANKGFTQRGFQKKRPPLLLERERLGASINGGEAGEPAPPREPLSFPWAALGHPQVLRERAICLSPDLTQVLHLRNAGSDLAENLTKFLVVVSF